MSKHKKNVSGRGNGPRRTRKSLVTAAAAIGAGGLIMGGPAAALMAAPAAQAAPVVPAPQQVDVLGGVLGFFGAAGQGGGISVQTVTGPLFGIADALLDAATFIPFLNFFVGNGADATTPGADGGDAIGIFAGNGGDGAPGLPGQPGGNGGDASPFGIYGTGGNGGRGGNGGYLADGTPFEAGDGGNGGAAAFLLGNGGAGGNGGTGRPGIDGVNPTTANSPDDPTVFDGDPGVLTPRRPRRRRRR